MAYIRDIYKQSIKQDLERESKYNFSKLLISKPINLNFEEICLHRY